MTAVFCQCSFGVRSFGNNGILAQSAVTYFQENLIRHHPFSYCRGFEAVLLQRISIVNGLEYFGVCVLLQVFVKTSKRTDDSTCSYHNCVPARIYRAFTLMSSGASELFTCSGINVYLPKPPMSVLSIFFLLM